MLGFRSDEGKRPRRMHPRRTRSTPSPDDFVHGRLFRIAQASGFGEESLDFVGRPALPAPPRDRNVDRNDGSGRSAMAEDDNTLASMLGLIDELRKVRLGLGEGPSRHMTIMTSARA